MIQIFVLLFLYLVALRLNSAIKPNNIQISMIACYHNISYYCLYLIIKFLQIVLFIQYVIKEIHLFAMQKEDIQVVNKIDKMLQERQCQQAKADQKYIQSLPAPFLNFLRQKQIPISQLTVPIPRYIRVKPTSNLKLQMTDIAKSLNIEQSLIVKIDDQFYALHPTVKINGCKLYEDGLIYGMDYSSSIPARALDVKENHTVLELCSAPGNKSMYIADNICTAKIVGVQVNSNRANVMKNLIKKYGLQKSIQVKVEDGVNFKSQTLFDRVLIDAECTHQGSIKHIKKFFPSQQKSRKKTKKDIKTQKYLSLQQQKQFQLNNSNPYTSEIKKLNQWSQEDFNQRFLDQKKLNNLSSLQLGLLQNGFRLLKQNGILVYSTCSFDQMQNQKIIQDFLKRHENILILNCWQQLICGVPYQKGKIQGTIKFSPSTSRCGGMFVCKLRKKITP